MVGTSKILTVSYGTFSCTLEGFDDPFSSMREIAEYFRDLAAEDRYFGAEPPTPDTEMLQQIAQAEARKRIEAKATADGVALRQVDVEDEEPAETKRQRKLRQRAEMKASAKARVTAEPAPEARTAPGDESIAAKMLRIRAAVARSHADESYEEQAAPSWGSPISAAFSDVRHDEVDDDEDEEPPVEAEAFVEVDDTGAEVMASGDAAEVMDPEPEPEVEAPVAPRLVQARVVKMNKRDFDRGVEPDAGVEEDGEGASAADFIRRALSGEAVADEPEEEVVAEAAPDLQAAFEDEAEPEPEPEAVDEGFLAVGADELEEEPAAEASEDEVTPEAEDAPAEVSFETGDVLALGADEAVEPVGEPEEAFEAEAEETAEDEAFADAEPEAEEPVEADDMDAEEAFEASSDDEAEDRVSAEPMAEVETADASEDDAAADAADAEALHAVTRALADDGDDSLMADAPEAEDEAEAHDNMFGDDAPESTLSEEDEAELMEELAEVEREVAETRKARDGKSVLEAHRSAESSVTRILRETESQLDDTDASRRRATIAHLKAAVAATRADGDEGKKDAPDEDENRYRDDLDRVVRPRRPGDGRVVTTPRRLAPLMLVSEQRVDLPAAGDQGDVRPRRITAGNLALQDEDEIEAPETDAADDEDNMIADSTSFEDYADKMGATELPDLLEAAAAYSAYVEGRPSFSRPQLMKQVSSLGGGDFSREDGLRSFGTLLRQGKIQKLKRGQFTIAKTSRFRPESSAN